MNYLVHNIFYIISFIICVYFFLVTTVNIIYLKKRSVIKHLQDEPFISVMIPARNEEQNIRTCVESLMDQNYSNYEILVIDDNSTDKTGEILAELSKEYHKLRVYSGTPLPEGWYGKPWALQQLSQHAKGEYFLFTDADTIHKKNSIKYMVSNLQHHKADLLSVLPKQLINSFGELLIVPAIYIMTSVLFPQPLIELSRSKFASYCLGQFFGIKASVYREMDGFESVRHLITEDVAFGREVKGRGYKTMFLDGHDYLDCRMYHSYMESFRGIGKNIYSSVGHNALVALAIVFLVAMLVGFPLYAVIHSIITGIALGKSLILVLIFFISWVFVTFYHRLPKYNAFLYPVQYLNMVILAVFYTIKFRIVPGVYWKGRKVE